MRKSPKIIIACAPTCSIHTQSMSLDERMAAAKRVAPELASLNMGPLIFDFSAAGRRVREWQNGLEQPYVEGACDRVIYNTNFYIERILREIGDALGLEVATPDEARALLELKGRVHVRF